jgi:hypothetical protein
MELPQDCVSGGFGINDVETSGSVTTVLFNS